MPIAPDTDGILLDAYAAQRCAVRLQNSFDSALRSLPRRERSDAEQRRIDAGNAHELTMLDAMADAMGDAMVRIEASGRAEAQEATMAAIAARVPVIAQAWLPPDRRNHRIGRPDLLILHGAQYLPVEIKLHLLTNPGRGSLLASAPTDPFPDAGSAVPARRLRKGSVWFNDALQLAHYRRMLEEHGIGAAEDLLGGILDGSGTVWWLPLGVAQPGSAVSVVDAYDQRFAELVALAGDARAWDADRSLPRPRSPWWHKECERCPYEEACHGELEEVDDVSLVRWMSEPTLARLRSVGVTTRTDLAGLDLSLVDLAHRLAETSLPLPDLLVELESHGSEASMDDIAGARLGARRRLAAAGIEVPSDLLDRDPTSLEVAGTIPDLGRLIRRARAHQAGGVIRQVPADQITGARADVEVDIDMESYEHATYLWGALVTTRPGIVLDDVTDGYRAFVTFDELTRAREEQIFVDFWHWLMGLRTRVRAQGKTFRAYCFWRAAEEGQMRRVTPSSLEDAPTERHLDRFFASADWVDLHELAAAQLITEGPLGLKVLATKAGFEWRDEDPSGEASIGWYEEAISPGGVAAQRRLLAYNEDDVRATRALRDWLEGPVRDLPHLDDPLGSIGQWP